MDLEIRRASREDAETIALLGRITFAETFGYLFQQHAGDLREYLDRTFHVEKIRRSLGEDENRYWLGSTDGFPMRYAKLKFPSPTPHLNSAEVAQLQKIYVLREFLGAGIGKHMLHAVLEDLRLRRIHKVWLDVLKENTRAIHFYERVGFSGLGEDHYTIGSQTFAFHLMARDL